jgi:hypothetical protein
MESTKPISNKAENGNKSKPMLCEVVLREKFTIAYDEAVTFSEQYENYQKIADNYAISFANWCLSTRFDSSGKYLNKTDLELIEIFKQTFEISEVQKETLNKLKTQKANISKFIRDAIKEKIERENLVKKDTIKKYSIEYLTQLLNNSF